MKKWLLSILAIAGIVIGIAGLILASIAVNEKNRLRTHSEMPSYEVVEKELEFWLVSDKIDVNNKTVYQDYVVYYAKDCNHNRYYEVVYVMRSGSLMSYYWEYSHWIPSDHSSWTYGN